MLEFKSHLILHIDDDEAWHAEVSEILADDAITALYGSLRQVKSLVTDDLGQGQLEHELERLVSGAGSSGALVHVVSGQVAREFLNRYTPAAIISDTGFPMNGVQTVQWLLKHNYENYPLIGLSSRDVHKLPEDVVRFYMESNARYFDKNRYNPSDLIKQIVFNTEFNRRTYSTV